MDRRVSVLAWITDERRSAMVGRALAVVTLTILTGGCDSAAPVYVYSKPGATLEGMSRDEVECAGGSGGGQSGPARLRRCMAERGYATQELRQGNYLELRGMPTPAQTP
jgi:hypothetical protein